MLNLKKAVGVLFKKKQGATARAASAFEPPPPLPPFPDAGADARVVIWYEPWCSESKKASRLVQERGWPTHREDLRGRHAEKLALFAKHGRRQLPLVFVDGRFIGGFRELEAMTELPARGEA